MTDSVDDRSFFAEEVSLLQDQMTRAGFKREAFQVCYNLLRFGDLCPDVDSGRRKFREWCDDVRTTLAQADDVSTDVTLANLYSVANAAEDRTRDLGW